ncbi:MAG: DUF1405 domain-containing protein [Thermoflexales bacterium]
MQLLNRVLHWSDVLIRSRSLAWAAFAACMGAFAFGTWGWYGTFLLAVRAPWWSIPFIPDCPLAAGLFGVAVLWMHYRRRSNLLNHVAAIACVKYGTWTMLFWALYWSAGGTFELSSLFSGPVMFATHFGLTVMGMWLMRHTTPHLPDALLATLWFVLSDVVDYAPIAPQRLGGYGYYPPLPPINGNPTALVQPMLIHAVLMTLLLGGLAISRALRVGGQLSRFGHTAEERALP